MATTSNAASAAQTERIRRCIPGTGHQHTPHATLDPRPGGRFCFRMEARDGTFGFDLEGEYTRVVPVSLIEYAFGDRNACVEFTELAGGVCVRVAFDSEQTHSIEQQREGWQAILDRFRRHVESVT